MNINLTAKYLHFLRKSHNYTQEELAEKLDISRQAISKWETGVTVPDVDVLLKLSKLYGISINDILEPKIQPQRIADFEQISTISEKELKEIFEQFDADSLVIALMGASPDTNQFCERLFPEIDFEKTRNQIGRVRVETVEEMQEQIVSMVNLHVVDGRMVHEK
ncbi:MAG: helix-turn-helix domain-containing protein [Lachnospiraceae bacterium]|nr:helix-turn-helix domain-containing protein [Lachnospiraceae bacterium]